MLNAKMTVMQSKLLNKSVHLLVCRLKKAHVLLMKSLLHYIMVLRNFYLSMYAHLNIILSHCCFYEVGLRNATIFPGFSFVLYPQSWPHIF